MVGTLRFSYDGDDGLGDRLLEAVLGGAKTATSSLAVEYLSGDPHPVVGERLALVDSHDTVRGVVETTRVRITPLHLIGDDVAHAEGEGFADAGEWRRDHDSFWDAVAHLIWGSSGSEGAAVGGDIGRLPTTRSPRRGMKSWWLSTG